MKARWIVMLAVLLALVFVGVGNRFSAGAADEEMAANTDVEEEAEGMTDSEYELADLHDESQGRIQEAEDQLADLEAEGPAETPALKAFAETQRRHLQKRTSLDKAILAIEDAAQLDRARQLVAQVNELEVEWDMVLAPGLNNAVAIEEMETQLGKKGNQNQREIVQKLKLLQKEDATARSQEFELFKARQLRTAAMDAMVGEFWGQE